MSWNCNKGGAQTRHTHTQRAMSAEFFLIDVVKCWIVVKMCGGGGVGVGVLKQKGRLIPYKTSNEDSGLHSILST